MPIRSRRSSSKRGEQCVGASQRLEHPRRVGLGHEPNLNRLRTVEASHANERCVVTVVELEEPRLTRDERGLSGNARRWIELATPTVVRDADLTICISTATTVTTTHSADYAAQAVAIGGL